MEAKEYRKKLISISKFLLYIICLYSTTKYSKNPKQLEHTHMYSDIEVLYMTNLSLYLTILLVSVGFIKYKSQYLSNIYTTIFPAIFTAEMIVTAGFWTLYFVAPKSLVNKKFLLDEYKTPLLTELGIHLFPFILLFLEQYKVSIPNSKASRLFLLFFFTAWITIVVIFGENRGKYLYPFMNRYPNGFLKILCFFASIPAFYSIGIGYLTLKAQEKNYVDVQSAPECVTY
ncbi:hypothetical protein GINT2_000026 [Glugoides intestinalis]